MKLRNKGILLSILLNIAVNTPSYTMESDADDYDFFSQIPPIELDIALAQILGTEPVTKRAKIDASHGPDSVNEDQSINQIPPAMKVNAPIQKTNIYFLPKDMLNYLFAFLDGTTALKIDSSVCKAFHKAVRFRGHIKFRHLNFTYLPSTDAATSMHRLFMGQAFLAFKAFLQTQTHLKSVDLSKVDDHLDVIIPLIVSKNPNIRHLDLGLHGTEPRIHLIQNKDISASAMESISQHCQDLESLVFNEASGSYLRPLLLEKNPQLLNNLQSLVLHNCQLSLSSRDSDKVKFFGHFIGGFPNLKKLVISGCRNLMVDTFKNDFKSPLKHLTLNTQAIKDIDLYNIMICCPGLRTIDLTNTTGISIVQVMQLIQKLSYLQYIILPRLEQVNNNRNESLAGKLSLHVGQDEERKITFKNTCLTKAYWPPIEFYRELSFTGLYDLTDLDLANTNLTDAELLEIPDLFPQIVSLNLSKTGYKKETFIAMLDKFKDLKSLNLSYYSGGAYKFVFLAAAKRVTCLDLSFCPTLGIDVLESMITRNKNLKWISVSVSSLLPREEIERLRKDFPICEIVIQGTVRAKEKKKYVRKINPVAVIHTHE